MTLNISDCYMALEISGIVVADATAQANSQWQVSTWPVLLDRNQAITALTITELLELGYPSSHPLVVALRSELA